MSQHPYKTPWSGTAVQIGSCPAPLLCPIRTPPKYDSAVVFTTAPRQIRRRLRIWRKRSSWVQIRQRCRISPSSQQIRERPRIWGVSNYHTYGHLERERTGAQPCDNVVARDVENPPGPKSASACRFHSVPTKSARDCGFGAGSHRPFKTASVGRFHPPRITRPNPAALTDLTAKIPVFQAITAK